MPSSLVRPSPFLRVLASGSSGNCAILRTPSTTILIDAGLSPRRTRHHLADLGLTLADLDAILLTHLDRDHFHAGWPKALPTGLPLFIHKDHTQAARARGLRPSQFHAFQDTVELAEDYCTFVTLSAHDQLGTAVFRFDFITGASLGYATDLGCLTDHLVEHLDRVDVLAIESNYCPQMQAHSDRPAFLKQRIMGGSGHLSNQECAQFVAKVQPQSHVILLHLSRECNTPTLAARLHAHKPYTLTIASQHTPSPWIEITPSPDQARVQAHPPLVHRLF